ncbi:MAG TPA: GMC family oxidoreductase [Prolixibacteraceae bacterium]|nr:GMC family oxidoreductase [Prolixibacteraceae bacterium]
MGNKHVNAIVVGAGAGGGIVAKELSVAGLSVVLFERGGWATFNDTDTDELISQRTTVLGNAYGPDNERYRRVIVNKDGNTSIVLPNEGAYNNNAACVGSGTVSYGAMAWRFMQEDFKLKTIYGHVDGSTLEDWPITYQDIEPFYEKAEWEIGVSGDDSQNPFAPPRHKPHPMPAFSHNKEARLLFDAAKRLGYHPFPIPMARNSVPYNGRPACIRMRTCCGFACPVNAKGGTQNTVIPTALETGNCELRIKSVVSEILVNEHGKITGIAYFDEKNNKQIQTADLVIISASATETARLLLNSKSKFFPNGIGNENDWVGRNLQGHAYTGAYGIFKDDIYDDVGPGASVAISDFNHHNAGIMGGGVLCNEFIRMPYLFTGIRPPGSARWGKDHKAFQQLNFKKLAQVVGPYQEIPKFDCRVEVDPTVKDFWGIPVVRLSGTRHEKDVEGCRFMSEKAELWLKEAGAISTWQSVGGGSGLSGGQHQAGTCRMGNDPKTSVTDKYGRIHAVPNLFIADGSLNVSNGGFNPALTIMALGYLIGDYIASEWLKGNRFR